MGVDSKGSTPRALRGDPGERLAFSMDAIPLAERLCRVLASLERPTAEWPAENEWPALILRARETKLAPLLYVRLQKRVDFERVPAQVRQELREAFLVSAGRQLLAERALCEALSVLGREKCSVVVLKGGYLAHAVFERPGARPMGDLDLLVPFEKVAEAIAALGLAGWMPNGPCLLEDLRLVQDQAPQLLRADGSCLELHWDLVRPGSSVQADVAGLFTRSIPFEVAGRAARGLCVEDLLLHLVVHDSVHHRFELGPRTLFDLAATLATHGARLDWPALAERARLWGAPGELFVFLSMARDLAGAAVPEGVLELVLPEGMDEGIVRDVQGLVLAGPRPYAAVSDNVRRVFLEGSASSKLGLFMRRLFPSPREMAAFYGIPARSPRMAVGYVRRVWDLTRAYGPEAMRLASGRLAPGGEEHPVDVSVKQADRLLARLRTCAMARNGKGRDDC